jgi:DNA-binding transcriptional ArsR family regulator
VNRALAPRTWLTAHGRAHRREDDQGCLILGDHDLVDVLVAAEGEPQLQAARLAFHVADALTGLEPARQIPEEVDGNGAAEPPRDGLADTILARAGYAAPSPRRAPSSIFNREFSVASQTAREHRHLLRYTAPIGALSSTLDGTFFALSDPTRRGILERLGGGPATISELAKPFGLTINGVKKHVGILERADLVTTEKVGRARHCRLGSGSLAEATAWIDEHRRAWESRLDRFERYVERTSGGGA